MKTILLFLTIAFLSQTSFALQCSNFFTQSQPKNRELLNSLKRIRNYGYFSNLILTDIKNNKMILVVFDTPKNGVIENRPSINDFVLELRSFASDIRFVLNDQTKNQILLTRLAKNPKEQKENNLEHSLNLETQELEVFNSTMKWLNKPGKLLNLIVLPIEYKESFIMLAKNNPNLAVHATSDVIEQMDPL